MRKHPITVNVWEATGRDPWLEDVLLDRRMITTTIHKPYGRNLSRTMNRLKDVLTREQFREVYLDLGTQIQGRKGD